VLTAQGTAFLHAGQEYGRTKQFLHPDYKRPVKKAPYKSTFMKSKNGKPFEYPYFIHDSYDSSDAVNLFHWARVYDSKNYPLHTQTREYTKGLIHLRRSSDAFRHKTMEAIFRKVTKIHAAEIGSWDLVIAYRLENLEGTEAYYIFINADQVPRKLSFHHDLRQGDILVDRERAGTEKITDPKGFSLDDQSIYLDPLTAVVIRTKEIYMGY
jgi:pullulanase